MPIKKLDDIDIYYEIAGQGPPLMLIGGYTCDYTVWDPIRPLLAKYHTLILFDNRGVGQTKDAGKPFTIETMAEDAKKLSEALNLQKPAVLGQSMGGAVVQALGARYPNAFSQLIILNSTMRFNLVSQMAMNNSFTLRKQGASLDLIIDCILPWVWSSEYLSVPDHIQAFKELARNNPYPQSLEDQQRQLLTLPAFNGEPHLAHISLPTLVIASANDILTPKEEGQALAKAIPHASFHLLPGGHASPLEQAQGLCDRVLAFLGKS